MNYIWWLWLGENSADHDLLNYLAFHFGKEVLRNHRLCRRTPDFSGCPPTPGLEHLHLNSVIKIRSEAHTPSWRWGQERQWVCAKASLLPGLLFFLNLNFNRARRVPALGCHSPPCLLNHWGTVGLWMHEEVLSAGTLEKAFKKKNIQPSMTPANPSPRMQIYFCERSGCLCVTVI